MSRLKETDNFLSLIRGWIVHPEYDMCFTPEEALTRFEEMFNEHFMSPEDSRLSRMVPGMGQVFCPLRIREAFAELNGKTSLLQRKHVPPTYAELRRVLNIAQAHAAAPRLKLVTFDADDTLFPAGVCVCVFVNVLTEFGAGTSLKSDDWIVQAIIHLLKHGVYVAVVTAAGYPGADGASKYETRLMGLLERIREEELDDDICSKFVVLGGECNYLCQCKAGHLAPVDRDVWTTDAMREWTEGKIEQLLDAAQESLLGHAQTLQLNVTLIRKERAVGLVPADPSKRIPYEMWEDVALEVQDALRSCPVPSCAFNGNLDVFVDVGNKKHGVQALQHYFSVEPSETVHFGDRFTTTGNDVAVRETALCVWVANASETCDLLQVILDDLRVSIRPFTPPTDESLPSASVLTSAWGTPKSSAANKNSD